jgi:hypothetical protein
VQYSTVRYGTVRYGTVQYITVLALQLRKNPGKTSVRVVMCNILYKTTFSEGKQSDMKTESKNRTSMENVHVLI